MLVVDELGAAEKFQCGGPENTIQLLREGKQFVAAGIHPDAKQPYRWEDTDEMPVDMPALAVLPRVKMTDLVRVLGENGFHPATTSASKPASGRKAELLAELRVSELDADMDGISESEGNAQVVLVDMLELPWLVKLRRTSGQFSRDLKKELFGGEGAQWLLHEGLLEYVPAQGRKKAATFRFTPAPAKPDEQALH